MSRARTNGIVASAIVLSLSVSCPALALPRLDPPFETGMVIQRGMPLTLTGTVSDADSVFVSLAKINSQAPVIDGKWKVTIDVPANESGENVLVIRSSSGDVSLPVLIGDLWMCSGQSNMAFTLRQASDGREILRSSLGLTIRMMNVEKPGPGRSSIAAGGWLKPDDPNAQDFSAVCLAFGVAVGSQAGVPIGLINASVGGTRIESWISEEGFKNNPEISPTNDRVKTRVETFERQVNKKLPAVGPSQLFQSMILPKTGAAIKGVLWYQGENNRVNASEYRILLQALIEDWRVHWKNPTMPFIVMQLPGFGKRSKFSAKSSWAYVRDSQLQAVKGIEHAVIVVTIDLGDETIHPRGKAEFGRRAAAAWQFYLNPAHQGYSVAPAPKSFSFGDTARVRMESPDGCLVNIGEFGDAFFLAGDDRRWFPADGFIDGKTIVLSSSSVTRPIAVRYAWADRPNSTLKSCSGLAAIPFRSDNWPASFDEHLLRNK